MEEDSIHIGRFSLMTTLLNVINESDIDSSSYVLARYFLEHFYELDKLNIYDVASDCFLSRSGVQRFCKSMGFDTFSSMKNSSPWERGVHRNAFLAYGSRADFRAHHRMETAQMASQVETMYDRQQGESLARCIHDSRHTVLLTAEYSSSGPKDLQQELMVAGKQLSLMTDSHPQLSLLRSLTDEDLLIVCSATGNYAYAVNSFIPEIGAQTVLLTMNRDPLFLETYHKIYYLTEAFDHNPRSAYTKYSISYFFDLLYNDYLRLYFPVKQKE